MLQRRAIEENHEELAATYGPSTDLNSLTAEKSNYWEKNISRRLVKINLSTCKE
jgi:hypothetical protein